MIKIPHGLIIKSKEKEKNQHLSRVKSNINKGALLKKLQCLLTKRNDIFDTTKRQHYTRISWFSFVWFYLWCMWGNAPFSVQFMFAVSWIDNLTYFFDINNSSVFTFTMVTIPCAFHFVEIYYFVEVRKENEWETRKIKFYLCFLFPFDLI